MAEFRYAQFCPLARTTEILGERWKLLVVRELLLDPERFSDRGCRRPGPSPSALSARMAHLGARGVVVRRQLPPPAPAQVFEPSGAGEALRPVVVERARRGARLLEAPAPALILEGPALVPLGLASDSLAPEQARARSDFRVRGEGADLADLPALFDSGDPPESEL